MGRHEHLDTKIARWFSRKGGWFVWTYLSQLILRKQAPTVTLTGAAAAFADRGTPFTDSGVRDCGGEL
jgi:hypothetical protein